MDYDHVQQRYKAIKINIKQKTLRKHLKHRIQVSVGFINTMNHHFGASFSVSILSSMILCLLMLLRTPSREVVFFRALPFSPPPPSLRCWGVLKLSLEENSSSKSKAMSFSSSWAVSSSSAPLSASSGGVGGLLPGHFQSSSSHPGPAKFNMVHIVPKLKLLIHIICDL